MIARVVVVVFSVFLFQNISIVKSGRIKRVINGREVPCDTETTDKIKKGLLNEVEKSWMGPVPPLPLLWRRSHSEIASLQNATSGQHLCGATILSAHYALTAAHCVTHPPRQYVLQLKNLCEGPAHAHVLEIIMHEQYDELSMAHDIALLRVKLAVDDTSWLKRISLPAFSFGLSGECTTFGYGQSKLHVKGSSETLLEGKMRVVSLDDCTEALGRIIAPKPTSGMLCAIGDGVDACEGDSGSPLICEGVIEAVTSYGMACAVRERPGVFTSVRAHVDWIRNIAGVG